MGEKHDLNNGLKYTNSYALALHMLASLSTIIVSTGFLMY